jgi:hypothetical protein
MELGEVGAEAGATIEVGEKDVVGSGTELIVPIEEDHVDVAAPKEEVVGKTTQVVPNTRTTLRIFWMKTSVCAFCRNYG